MLIQQPLRDGILLLQTDPVILVPVRRRIPDLAHSFDCLSMLFPQLRLLSGRLGNLFERPLLVQGIDKGADRQLLLLLRRKAGDLFPFVPLALVARLSHIRLYVFNGPAVHVNIVLLEHALDQLAVHDRHRAEVNFIRASADRSFHKQQVQLIGEPQR